MALHEQCVGATDEWYTPPYIFDALSCSFDLDVAHPGKSVIGWIPAKRVIRTDSLNKEWSGFVWMNPPFGPRNGIVPWLEKFVQHGDGVALTPDRTSAPWWQKYAVQMDVVLFISPKIKFIDKDGNPGRSPAQGTTLMALGKRGCEALYRARSLGVVMMNK